MSTSCLHLFLSVCHATALGEVTMGLIPTLQTGTSRVEQVPEGPVACFTEEKLLGEQQRKGFGPGKAKSNRTHPSLFTLSRVELHCAVNLPQATSGSLPLSE